jgi:hypothetical protein
MIGAELKPIKKKMLIPEVLTGLTRIGLLLRLARGSLIRWFRMDGLGGLLLLERLSSLSRIRLAMYKFNGGGRHNKENRGFLYRHHSYLVDCVIRGLLQSREWLSGFYHFITGNIVEDMWVFILVTIIFGFGFRFRGFYKL